jgi:Transport and Golgi organisation 2
VCTIAFGWDPGSPTSVVLGANRDELVARPSDPPARLAKDPDVWGGRDLSAGGTWLAVDRSGRICAVTNRHPLSGRVERDPSKRSRGELPLRILEAGGADGLAADSGALEALSGLDPASYNPVNVLYLSRTAARWVSLDHVRGRTVVDIEPGIHILGVHDLDDRTDPKTVRLRAMASGGTSAAGVAEDGTARLLERFERLLRSHDTDDGVPHTAGCIHGEVYGTVSSATVTVGPGGVAFRHAEGHPCVTPYVSILNARERDRALGP